MKARTKLSKQGNSTGLTLTREFLEQLGWSRGQEVSVEIVGDHLEVRAADPVYDQAMDAVERCFGRYPTTLKRLAE